MPRKPRCTFVDPVWGERCPNPGSGRPAFCEDHDPDVEYDAVDTLLAGVLDHPSVQGILGKVGTVLDKAANLLDKTPPGGFRPPGGAPPPNRQPPPEDPFLVLGFEKGQPLTAEMVKERRKALASLVHPDKQGGSNAAMARINRAADFLLAHL